MHYSIDLANHIRTVGDCAERLGFDASVNARNFALDIRKGGLEIRFQPRFLYIDREKGRRNLTYYVRPDMRGFVGWLPYFNKVWPEAVDKLAFKARCRELGLLTPDWWTTAPAGLSDFIIKRKSGSLGIGMRGPFRAADRGNPYHQLVEAEFYERYVEGRIAKIWYWNAHPVCAEILDCPQLTGDGKRSIRQLIEARLAATLGQFANTVPMSVIEPVITYYGRTFDTVPAVGEKIHGSFRYASLLEQANSGNRNSLAPLHKTPVEEQLLAIGRSLWEVIPKEISRGVLYTVDAVVDAQDQFWLLEMNPNPGIHPDCYPAMIASVLQEDVSHMPSRSKLAPDAMHMKGQLVWAEQTRIFAGKRIGKANS